MAIVVVILSILITYKICNKMNNNTIGTTTAYVKRAFCVWLIVIAVLACGCSYLGLI